MFLFLLFVCLVGFFLIVCHWMQELRNCRGAAGNLVSVSGKCSPAQLDIIGQLLNS